MLILQQMIIFVLLMAVGALARRYEILTPANQPQITKLVVNIAYPAIILSGVTGKGPRIEGAELAYAFGVILTMLVLLMACAWILPRILRYPKKHYGIFFSYVIQTIKGSSDKKEPFRWQSLANTGMGACILAIILYLSGIELPYILAQSIIMLGSMTAPLAMMLLGSFLTDTAWKCMINGRIIAFTILKMVVIPIVLTLILGRFVDNTYLLAICMAALATPSGNIIPLLAAVYNKDAYPVSVEGIALTTAAAVVTMPIVAVVTGLG